MKNPLNMKSSNVGAIVLATEQGLGYMAREFFKKELIDKVYIHAHSSRKNFWEWYPTRSRVYSREVLIEECEKIIFFETPFNWDIIPKAREKGKKTILMPMYECTRYPLPYQPDIILTPSDLDKKYYPDSIRINVPVDKKWKERTFAKVFVHNAGNGGLGGRNGTKELVEAMKYVRSPIKLIIRSQIPIKIPFDYRIDLRIGSFDDIWSEGDVFIFPEKFNGLSLPLQEAFASGMMVMCGNRFPMNTWLPNDCLIPVEGYKKERLAVEFESAIINPLDIAKTIDKWYNQDIRLFSHAGKAWGEQNSWKSLRPLYNSILRS